MGGAALSALTAGGIVGFYLFTVIAIGRALAGVCRGSRYKLIIDEMPEVNDLVRDPPAPLFASHMQLESFQRSRVGFVFTSLS